jgi:hypothetical protein
MSRLLGYSGITTYNKDEEAHYFEGRKKAIESIAAKSMSQALARGFRL